MVDHERMTFAAAGGREQHGHVDERVVAHEVEQVLEKARV